MKMLTINAKFENVEVTKSPREFEQALFEFLKENDVNVTLKAMMLDDEQIDTYIGIDSLVQDEIAIYLYDSPPTYVEVHHYRKHAIGRYDLADPTSFEKILNKVMNSLGDIDYDDLPR